MVGRVFVMSAPYESHLTLKKIQKLHSDKKLTYDVLNFLMDVNSIPLR